MRDSFSPEESDLTQNLRSILSYLYTSTRRDGWRVGALSRVRSCRRISLNLSNYASCSRAQAPARASVARGSSMATPLTEHADACSWAIVPAQSPAQVPLTFLSPFPNSEADEGEAVRGECEHDQRGRKHSREITNQNLSGLLISRCSRRTVDADKRVVHPLPARTEVFERDLADKNHSLTTFGTRRVVWILNPRRMAAGRRGNGIWRCGRPGRWPARQVTP
jgi:hypothetical protein